MKKFIIVVGLLLVAAVFMSGCVTETEDPIVGIWHNTGTVTTLEGFSFDSGHYIFNADGTGSSLLKFAGDVVYGLVEFTWKSESDGKYTIMRQDIKKSELPKSEELALEGDSLIYRSFEFHKESAAEYLVGLWVSDLSAYDRPDGLVCLMYVAEDGTGNTMVYGSDVMGIDDVYTTAFTWEEKDGVMYGIEEDGEEFVLTLKNGALYNGKEEAFHKYTVEDRLLGIWMSDEPSKEDEGTFDIVILLRPDGTGVEIWTVPGSHVASAKYYFDWEMTGPITYQAVYDDGEIWDFENVGLGISDGEVTYSKVGYDALAEYAKKVNA